MGLCVAAPALDTCEAMTSRVRLTSQSAFLDISGVNISRGRGRESGPFFSEHKYCRVPERRGPHLPCRSRQRQTEITTSVVLPALILPHLSVRYAIKHSRSPRRAPCLSRKHSNVYAWEGGLVSKHGARWHSRHETPPPSIPTGQVMCGPRGSQVGGPQTSIFLNSALDFVHGWRLWHLAESKRDR